MQKTNIEWTDYSWNPIKGICPVGCWYCYARKIYQRFLSDKYFGADSFLDVKDLFNPEKLKKPSKIFVCSTIELFHPDVKIWANQIFEIIEKCPQHIFQILTKFPQNIDRPMPDNVHLGVTITKDEDIWRRNRLVTTDAKIKFISFEPLLEDLDFTLYQEVNWIIIGRLTQHGHKYDPKLKWITKLVNECTKHGVKIFLKENLKSIWGNNLIQQFPTGK